MMYIQMWRVQQRKRHTALIHLKNKHNAVYTVLFSCPKECKVKGKRPDTRRLIAKQRKPTTTAACHCQRRSKLQCCIWTSMERTVSYLGFLLFWMALLQSGKHLFASLVFDSFLFRWKKVHQLSLVSSYNKGFFCCYFCFSAWKIKARSKKQINKILK